MALVNCLECGKKLSDKAPWLLIFTFLSMLFHGCVSTSQTAISPKPSFNNESIEVDLTENVIACQAIVSNERKKLHKNYSLHKLFEKYAVVPSKNYQRCVQSQIDALIREYRSIIAQEYNVFKKKLQQCSFNYQSYFEQHSTNNIWQKFELNGDFFDKTQHESRNTNLIYDFSRLNLKKRIVNIGNTPTLTTSGLLKKDGKGYNLTITYTKTIGKRVLQNFKKEIIGVDIFRIDFSDRQKTLKIRRLANESINVVQNIKAVGMLLKVPMKDSNDSYHIIRHSGLWDTKEALISKLDIQKNKTKISLQEITERADSIPIGVTSPYFCWAIAKNLKKFEEKKEVSIKEVFDARYKNKVYLNIEMIHLNILNNANIKLNDHYKISRYLFDEIIRSGLRFFHDGMLVNESQGISFNILSSDKNFISENEMDFASYQFYLPRKEISLYLNDDITGKHLADTSYILVDGERIELR